MEGTKKKSMSFHQYSWNSEVETTWISLIGWHHKTSSKHLSLVNKVGDKTVHCISKVLSDETVFVDDNLWFVIISNDILFEKLLIESHARLIQGNLVHWFVGRLSSGGLSRGCCWGQSKSKDRQPKAKTDLTLVVLCCVCTVLVFCKGPFYCVCARKLKVLSHLHQVSAKGRRKAAGAAARRRA